MSKPSPSEDTPPMKFRLPCTPPKSTAQMTKIARWTDAKTGDLTARVVPNRAAARARNSLYGMFLPASPREGLIGPIMASLTLVWPWRESEPMKNRRGGFRFSDKRPDVDNAAKMILDVMADVGFFASGNDAQVARLEAVKGWGDRPGIYVRLVALGEYDALRLAEDLGAYSGGPP